jgi:hypothetical protein
MFVIMLSDLGFKQSFGSQDPYFSRTLPKQGRLINEYYAVAGSELANGIAVISGQGPTKQTAANCPTFTPIKPGTIKHGQVTGDGCVYPAKTPTLADELAKKGLSWKAYVQSSDVSASGRPTSCRHPALGSRDAEQAPRTGDPYVTWHNPFVYFKSVTDKGSCKANDIGLGTLAGDLDKPSTAPAVAYIVPSPCDNGSPQPCTPGAPAGLAPAADFLGTVLPEIQNSAAYKDNGVIVITSDQAPQSGPNADPSACCNNPTYPNVPPSTATGTTTSATTTTPTTTTTSSSTSTSTTDTSTSTTPTTSTTSTSSTTPTTSTTSTTSTSTTSTTSTSTTPTTTTPTTTSPTTTSPTAGGGSGQTTPTGGGGQVGLLLISRYVEKNSVDLVDFYNHYSLLATIENIFGLGKLGYSADRTLPSFDAGIFNGKF